MKDILLVALGGSIGALLRYFTNLFITNCCTNSKINISTIVVNILGSFILGMFLGLINRYALSISNELKLFFAIGICGSYTTFSTFIMDAYYLIIRGDYISVAIYFMISIVVSMIFIGLGLYLSSINF